MPTTPDSTQTHLPPLLTPSIAPGEYAYPTPVSQIAEQATPIHIHSPARWVERVDGQPETRFRRALFT